MPPHTDPHGHQQQACKPGPPPGLRTRAGTCSRTPKRATPHTNKAGKVTPLPENPHRHLQQAAKEGHVAHGPQLGERELQAKGKEQEVHAQLRH